MNEWTRRNESEIYITLEFLPIIRPLVIFIRRLLPFHRHLPLSYCSPAALLPLFQTPLFCFEKRAWLDSNRGSTVPKLRVLVQYAHQHRNSRHKRSAVHSPPPTPQWTSIFFAIIVVILHGCYCRLLMDFLMNYHRCFPRWCLRFLNEVELTRYSWRLWCSLSSPIR